MTIYGLGDIAVSIVNFFLLPVFVTYFTAADYGVLAILGSIEVVAKIVFRFGLDGAFMRFYYASSEYRDRQALASTIFYFLLGLNAAVLVPLLVWSDALSVLLFGTARHASALRLMLLNTFVIGFTFIPFHVLRIEQRSTLFSVLTLARSVATILLRLVVVIVLGMRVTGLYLADAIVTASIMVALIPWFRPLVRLAFSPRMLRDTLIFGLPRVPHAAAQQVLAVGDRFILNRFMAESQVGIYQIAVSFGLAQKLFLSAFESAWAPFYYESVQRPEGPGDVFRRVTTYAIAVLALLTAGVSAVGGPAVAAMTHGRLLSPDDPQWVDVSIVVTLTAVGVFLQGFYLLTSIGLNITKRTQYYPVATLAAASVNIGLNLVLIPRYGIVGAAYANGVGYGIQALLGYLFSQRFYRIEYDWGRIARVVAAGALSAAIAHAIPRVRLSGVDPRSAIASLPDAAVRGVVVVAVYLGFLWLAGLLSAREISWVRDRLRRRTPIPVTPPPDATDAAGAIAGVDLPSVTDQPQIVEPQR